MRSTIIENGTIVTLGEKNRVLTNHAILIENEKITKIVPTVELRNKKIHQIIDATGKVVMPGFINTHMHFYSTFVRGLGKAKPSSNFQEILENLWWRLDKKLTVEDNYYSALYSCIDAIKHGTTTLIDHHASPFSVKGSLDEVARAVTEAGVRASLCYELSDRDGKKIAQEGLEENVRFIEECQKNPNDSLRALFGLHASFTIEDETLRAAAAHGKSLDCGFHIHCAEAESDQEMTQKKFGKRVVERLYAEGILGHQTICAHGVHLTSHEMDLLKQTDTILVHNPQSNMNNAVGVASLFSLLEKGILVGLGTDAMTTNMLEELRSALWLHKLTQKNPSVGFFEVTGLLTQNNRKIAERYWGPGIGSISEGARADIILLDYHSPTEFSEATFLGHLTFGLSQAQVDTTMVAGRILMQNKKLLHLDEEFIAHRARELSKKLWERF